VNDILSEVSQVGEDIRILLSELQESNEVFVKTLIDKCDECRIFKGKELEKYTVSTTFIDQAMTKLSIANEVSRHKLQLKRKRLV
jgi:hypothetical protein